MTETKVVLIVLGNVIGEVVAAVGVVKTRRSVLGIGGRWPSQHLDLGREVGKLFHILNNSSTKY